MKKESNNDIDEPRFETPNLQTHVQFNHILRDFIVISVAYIALASFQLEFSHILLRMV